jgi:hypothetical protein
MMSKNLSKLSLDKAKKMFMDYKSLADIAKVLKCSRSAIQYHASNGWSKERDLSRVEKDSSLKEIKQVEFNSITESTIHIMRRALHDLANRDRPPTVTEAKQASEIMEKLDKITRLDKGEATDIVSNQEKVMTVETIARKLSLDPFQQKGIDFEEKE